MPSIPGEKNNIIIWGGGGDTPNIFDSTAQLSHKGITQLFLE